MRRLQGGKLRPRAECALDNGFCLRVYGELPWETHRLSVGALKYNSCLGNGKRLESLGLLVSEWRIEDGPPRRYYTLSPEGVRHYQDLSTSWSELVATVNRLIADKK